MIYQCATCHQAVVRQAGEEYLWASGHMHDCNQRREMARWLDVIASDALDGDSDAAELLPAVVEAWLHAS